MEQALAQLWSELLKVERVSRWDHFFELGGHSLLAITLLERMRQQGLHADVRVLFTTPILAGLASAVDGRAPGVQIEVPPNQIPEDCQHIRCEQLPLIELTQTEIDCIVESVPGGAANVRDIYPLAPLQEGIFFHHRLAEKGDAYLMCTVIGFDSRERLDGFLGALQLVIDRHDILRTAVQWKGLREPVQVVWRRAPIQVEEIALSGGEAVKELLSLIDPRHHRIDVSQAPLIHGHIAEDRAEGRSLLALRYHHLAIDHTTWEVILGEVQAHLLAQAHRLPGPLSFRNFVVQATLGVRQEEHEAFFRPDAGDRGGAHDAVWRAECAGRRLRYQRSTTTTRPRTITATSHPGPGLRS